MAETADAAVADRIRHLDRLLEQLENSPGPVGEMALEAIRALADTYGEALSRVVRCASPETLDRLASEELVQHLLVLHGIHPDPVQQRIERALAQVRPYVQSHGGEVELAEIRGTTATVRMSGACGSCSSSAATLQDAVTEAVLAVAPELERVEAVQEQHATVIPVDSLLRRPAGASP